MRKPNAARKNAFPPLLHGSPRCKPIELFDYYHEVYNTPKLYPREWSLYKIYNHINNEEKEIPSTRHVCIRADAKNPLRIRTAIMCGTGSSPWIRIDSDTVCPTWHTDTRKILFFMVIPAEKSMNMRAIKKCLQSGRGPAHKIVLGVKYALKNKFPFRISTDVFDRSSRFFMDECVVELKRNTKIAAILERMLREARDVYNIITGAVDKV